MENNTLFKIQRETLSEVSFNELMLENPQRIDLISSEIESIFNTIQLNRDQLIITISLNSEPRTIVYDNSGKKISFVGEAKLFFDVKDEEDTVNISLKIKKKNINNILSVYSLVNLGKFFRNNTQNGEIVPKTLEEMFNFSIDYLHFDNIQFFELINDNANFSSKSFVFTNNIKQSDAASVNKITTERKKLNNIKEKFCNFIFDRKIDFLPSDFYLISEDSIDKEIKAFFYIICLSISLTFVVDTMKINDDIVEYKIYGYRNMHKKKNLAEIENLSFKQEEYFNIYCWIYEDNSNVSERIGMARNVMTLFTNGDDIFTTKESVLPSIKSSFDIYLKENVDKYIEILNQVALLLNDVKKQGIEVADSFTKDFKNNCFAIFAFFSTTILFNTLSTGKLGDIFSKDITAITLGFLCISLIYWIISLFELKVKINRLKNSYERNKSYYKPILDPEDLERIFNHGDYYSEDEKSILKIRNLISVLWLGIIIVIFTIVLYLGDSTVFNSIKNLISLLVWFVSFVN